MTKRIRTTFTFKGNGQNKASLFSAWLNTQTNNIYGDPKFIYSRHVGNDEWCVEYEYDANCEIARGVAIGIAFASI